MNAPELAQPKIESDRGRISAIWAVPAGAVLLALFLTAQHYLDRGPVIEVSFSTAAGLEAQKTPLKYRDVEVGVVEDIRLDTENQRVIAAIRLDNEVAAFVDAEAEFWVVRPRLSLSEVSGIETLLSGAYVQGSWDAKPGQSQDEFVGLEEPPPTPPGTPGRRIVLRSYRGGTLTPGAPVFYKHVPVGRIESERFTDNGDAVEYEVFVDDPHHRRLTTASKFWSAGGISLELGVDGISTGIESLESFLSGGVAFDTLVLDAMHDLPRPVKDGVVFRLHRNEKEARNSLYTEGHAGVRFTVVFNESVRGLRPGAPVEMDGIRVGEVLEVLAQVGEEPGQLVVRAVMELQPGRIGAPEVTPTEAASYLDVAVREGLRAKLASGNILTGALYVTLVRVEGEGGAIDFDAQPYPRFPSTESDLDALTGSLGRLSANLAALPLDQLVGAATRALDDVHLILSRSDAPARLSSTLASVDVAAQAIASSAGELPRLIDSLNRAADSAEGALGAFAAGSELHYEAKAAIRELREAAKAIEALAKTVSDKPNALLLGK